MFVVVIVLFVLNDFLFWALKKMAILKCFQNAVSELLNSKSACWCLAVLEVGWCLTPGLFSPSPLFCYLLT